MSGNIYYTIFSILMIAHIFMAFFVSVEIRDYPLIPKIRRVKWLMTVWLLPVIGTIWARKKLGLKWVSGSSSGGDVTTGGYSGTDSGGCGGGDGSCH